MSSAEVRIVADPDELRRFFDDVPAAHIYAIADLEPPFWEPSTWYRRDDAVVGFVLLPDAAEAVTVYAVATRDPTATLELVRDLLGSIEPGTLITGPLGLAEMLATADRDVAWHGPHVRYLLDDGGGDHASLAAPTVHLEPQHVDVLEGLYATEPGAAFFLPHMLDDHSFVGVFDGDDLVAAAGTHVLSDRCRCAAIGSVYTRPSHRGRGLGAAVTAGVIARISSRVDLIGLNVAADNTPALHIYERLGFRPVLHYSEAEVR